MRIQFLGATGTVTGSKYLIESGSQKILVDCGLFQGIRELRERNWSEFPIDPKDIDAVVLTHAHIDHTGYLPALVKRGFVGPIYCTSATRALCKILLPDSGRLQEEEAYYAAKMGYSRHKKPIPLYTQEDAEKSLRQFKSVDFGSTVTIGENLTLRFTSSGHILGSAFVSLSDGKRSIVFSGDLGREHDPVLRPPEVIEKADYVVVESTYGDRIHDPADPLDQLEPIIKHAMEKRGVIVVPAFAVGRSQTLLYLVYLLKKSGRIADLPVFLDSPMSVNAQHIFCDHFGEHKLNAEQCQGMCEVAKYINSPEESKSLDRKKGPMLIISASGMATGGRVLHHLKAFAPDPRNTILFTGYQAQGTRGAQLLGGAKTLKIHGELVPVGADVRVIHNLSAHADQKEIVSWLSHFRIPPKMTFITHGEKASAQALQRNLQTTLKWESRIPDYLETQELS